MLIHHQDRVWIEEKVRAAGFDLAGLAAVPAEGSPEETQSDLRFADWIASGHAGEMNWLKRADATGNLVRGDLKRSMPWARTVIICAMNYNADAPRSVDPAPPNCGWIARYAWSGREDNSEGFYPGSDYHDVLLTRLRGIEAALRQRFNNPMESRSYVDTGPLLEREYAQRAGIGWIGKNTCVLNEKVGSWLLLGAIVTSLELAAEALAFPAADRCGTCARCIDACPTQALIAPRVMDASRCISYLTIEKKGAIDDSLRAPIGRQVFGCDICQDVCPWNSKAPVASSGALPERAELVNPALEWLASMDGPQFNRTFRNSPLERTGRKRLQRNVAIAMGNSGDPSFVPKLREWAASDDPIVAEAARWALDRLSQ
jgi:epoxyqueuosine reductase